MGNYSVVSRKKALTRVAARTASIIFDYSERICLILFIDTKNTRNNRRRNLGIFRVEFFHWQYVINRISPSTASLF